VLVLAAGCGAVPAAERSDFSEAQAEEELEALRDRIQAVRERLETDQGTRSDVERRIEALDRDIAALAGEIRRTEAEQAAAQVQLERLEERMAEARERLAAHRDEVAALAYSTYVMGRQSHLKLFLNQQDPAVINRMLGYHDYIVAARARTIGRINEWAEEIELLAAEQAARREELEALAEQLRSQQQALRARKSERETALAALEDRIASSEGELSRLRENEIQLEEILRELDRYSSQSRQVAEGAFRRMQGRLRLPVSAPIAARYGETRSTGVRWDGVMFRPESGEEVSAIFEGRVVCADWLRGFGLLLIIDHGDGYMSLYSHNESLFKQIGDWVDTGEVIATVGTSGGLDKPGLYFEIRQDGEPQNPLSWCQRA